MDEAAKQPEPKPEAENQEFDRNLTLRQSWKTALQIQGEADSGTDLIQDETGRQLGSQLIELCCGLLDDDNLQTAQFFLFNSASLKSKKQEQQLFPSKILDRSFFKSRGGLLWSNQDQGQETAAYSTTNSENGESGIQAFVKDFTDHLQALDKKLQDQPSNEDAESVKELSMLALTHASTEFKEEMRQLTRESKPFKLAADSVQRAFALETPAPGEPEANTSQPPPTVSPVLQAYCASVLNRLESTERLGVAKSARIFEKYLADPESTPSPLNLKQILGNKPPNSFPELHHLPSEEFVTLAGSDLPDQEGGREFLHLLSRVSRKINLEKRELARLETLSQYHCNQLFEVREDDTEMAPVKSRVTTRPLMSAYRQVRSQLKELGILGGNGRHAFGWYSVPRVTEAFLVGQFENLSVTGILPLGTDQDPWSQEHSDLQMEYNLAKVQRQFYEPPLISTAASAFVYLSWEIASLGVATESIKLESSDEEKAALTLSFEYPPEEAENVPSSRTLSYQMADIEGTRPKDLVLPVETDPVMFESSDSDLPTALFFVGESIVKELPLYQRFSYGKNIVLYVLETCLAPKPRKEKQPPPAKKAPEQPKPEVKTPQAKTKDQQVTEMPRVAMDLLKEDESLRILQQESLAFTKDVLERIATDRKVAGKQRRNFRRLHRQLRHREGRGFSNRLEGQFISKLAQLSKLFDSSEEN